jgi:hypothetical protein
LVAHWGWLEEGSFRWPAARSSNMASMAAILDFGFRRLSDERLLWLGVINRHHIPLLPKPYLPYIYPHTTSHSGAYATPCVALVGTYLVGCFKPRPSYTATTYAHPFTSSPLEPFLPPGLLI